MQTFNFKGGWIARYACMQPLLYVWPKLSLGRPGDEAKIQVWDEDIASMQGAGKVYDSCM